MRTQAASNAPTSVLLVEDEPAVARLIKEALAGSLGQAFRVDWVAQLAAALERLGETAADIVLLDLFLPDRQGSDVFEQISRAAPRAQIIVLSGG